MAVCFVYVTVPDRDTASSIARAIIADGLAACANILGGMRSIYRWQGAIEEAEETVLILKTVADRFDALAAGVRALHPYDTPCIVALPVNAGDPRYLAWIAAESGALPSSVSTGP